MLDPETGIVKWGSFSPAFLDSLANALSGRRVLEVFAGNGFLASELSRRGIDIVATTLFSGHDGHDRGMHFAVEELEASAAIAKHGKNRDLLLMSWPVSTPSATFAALRWGLDRPIAFIGEISNPARGLYGGCADDLFFELTRTISEIPGFQPRNMLEKALILEIDREAVIRRTTFDHDPVTPRI